MGDYSEYKSVDMAVFTLEALIRKIRACQDGSVHNKRPGFDNDDVIWMIKVWSKATLVRLGLSGSDWIYYRFKREPAKLAGKQKRSDVLWMALADFKVSLQNQDQYRRSREAMLNFVWDFHRRISDVDQSTDFVTQVNQLISGGVDALVKEAYFPAESSI